MSGGVSQPTRNRDIFYHALLLILYQHATMHSTRFQHIGISMRGVSVHR